MMLFHLLCFGSLLLSLHSSAGVSTIEETKTGSEVKITIQIPVEASIPDEVAIKKKEEITFNDLGTAAVGQKPEAKPLFTLKQLRKLSKKNMVIESKMCNQVVIEPTDPEMTLHIETRKEGQIQEGDHVLASCQPFHYVIGDSVAVCTANGWMPPVLGCCAPVCLGIGTIVQISGNTSSTTNTTEEKCDRTTPGLAYNLPLPTGLVTFSTCNNADFATIVAIFDGTTCGLIKQNAFGCDSQSLMAVRLVPAESYVVVVTGLSAATGSFNLTISC